VVDGLQQPLRGGSVLAVNFGSHLPHRSPVRVLRLLWREPRSRALCRAGRRAQDCHLSPPSAPELPDLQWQREEQADCRSCRAEGKGRRVEHVVFVLVVGVWLWKAQEQEGDAMSEREREMVIEIKTGNSSVTKSEFILSI